MNHEDPLLGLRSRCSVTDEACCELAKLVKVTHLDLRYCPLTNGGMAIISHGMPRLEYCNVEGCKLTCLGMLALMRRHKRLRVWGPGMIPGHYRLWWPNQRRPQR